MAVVKTKPTSPGRRFVVKVVNPELHKGAPHKALLAPQSKTGGRNNAGRITTRHRGGGHKQHYRIIDWKRTKDGIPAVVERLEYDPNRTANIALLKYADGERRYIIAPKGVHAGDPIMSGPTAPIRSGNTLALRSIPVALYFAAVRGTPVDFHESRNALCPVEITIDICRAGSDVRCAFIIGDHRRICQECFVRKAAHRRGVYPVIGAGNGGEP